MCKKILLLVIIIATFSITIKAEDGSGGQSSAFLRRGINSRALAMGGAYTGLSNDISSTYWNPAGLTGLSKTEFMGMISLLNYDRSEIYAAAGHNFSDDIVIGLGWYKFGVGNIDGRDLNGDATEIFDDSQNCLMLSVAKRFNAFSFGVTGKYINHSLYKNSASGLAFDLGIKVALLDNSLNLGFVIQDLGGKIKWDTANKTEESLPTTLRIGASYNLQFINAIVSTEFVKVNQEKSLLRAGAEYSIVQFFGVRAGYDGFNPTFGLFIKLPDNLFPLRLDYAAINDKISNGYVNQISFQIYL